MDKSKKQDILSIMTAKEILALLRVYRLEKDSATKAKIEAELMEASRPLYTNYLGRIGWNTPDMRQEAAIVTLNCIRGFKLSKKVYFSTYLYTALFQSLQHKIGQERRFPQTSLEQSRVEYDKGGDGSGEGYQPTLKNCIFIKEETPTEVPQAIISILKDNVALLPPRSIHLLRRIYLQGETIADIAAEQDVLPVKLERHIRTLLRKIKKAHDRQS